MKVNNLLIYILGFVFLMGMTSCKSDEEKFIEAIREIESYVAENDYKRARNTIEDIPSAYFSEIAEMSNIIDKSECMYLVSKGEKEKAKDLFIKLSADDDSCRERFLCSWCCG